MASQEHRRLAGRVGPSDDVDLVAGARRSLRDRRTVEDPAARQGVGARHVELAVGDAGGQQHGVGDDLTTVVEADGS